MKIDPIQSVADELEILRILATLAQSVDDRDEARYCACLADEVMVPAPRRPQPLACHEWFNHGVRASRTLPTIWAQSCSVSAVGLRAA